MQLWLLIIRATYMHYAFRKVIIRTLRKSSICVSILRMIAMMEIWVKV